MAADKRQGSACIVLVEDDAASSCALRRLLTAAGYHVVSAASVGEAREVVGRHGCDLLIADLGLPDGSGLDLLRELRDTHGLQKGIALTGFTNDDDVAACAAAGFSAYLPKPVRFPELESTVRRVLGGAAPPILADGDRPPTPPPP